MKKNIIRVLMASFVLIIFSATLISCTMNNDQWMMVATQSGLYSAVGWIAIDNPDQEVKQSVKLVTQWIDIKSGEVSSTNTFTGSLYSDLSYYIDDTELIPINIKPITKVASLTILNGIDMVVLSIPNAQSNVTFITSLVSCYCNGFNSGLNLSNNDKLIEASKKSYQLREIQVYKIMKMKELKPETIN